MATEPLRRHDRSHPVKTLRNLAIMFAVLRDVALGRINLQDAPSRPMKAWW